MQEEKFLLTAVKVEDVPQEHILFMNESIFLRHGAPEGQLRGSADQSRRDLQWLLKIKHKNKKGRVPSNQSGNRWAFAQHR